MNPVRRWLEDARSAPDTRYVDACDGVRALAILIVGWYHIWQQSWLAPNLVLFGRWVSFDPLVRSGYMWVDLVLLVSGFVLYLPWARAQEGRAPYAAADFYAKRLFRVHPSYLLAVLAVLPVSVLCGMYADGGSIALDLVSHLTYTHTFFYNAYYATNLGGPLWTLAIEMQFYLIFPLLARSFRRAPGATFAAMTFGALAFRLWVGQTFADISIWFNQLPAFMDIYAFGMAAAAVHVRLSGMRRGVLARVACTLGALWCLSKLWGAARVQASCLTTEAIRQGQMDRRLLIASVGALLLLCSANAGLLWRRLLCNPLTRFVSAVSMQFYIWHQTLAVWLVRWRVVPSAYEHPNYDGDAVWQMRFTLVCFAVSFALAALLTYGFERPVARRLWARWQAYRARGAARRRRSGAAIRRRRSTAGANHREE